MTIEFSTEVQTVIDEGRHAWECLLSCQDQTWNDWLAVGEAIQTGETEMLHRLGMNKPTGRRWAINFGDWLRETEFIRIDKPTRSYLRKCMSHRLEIEAWREQLPVEKRATWNHPQTVWQKWKAQFGAATQTTEGPPKTPLLQDANSQLQTDPDEAPVATDQLKEGGESSHELSFDLQSNPTNTARLLLATDPKQAQAFANALRQFLTLLNIRIRKAAHESHYSIEQMDYEIWRFLLVPNGSFSNRETLKARVKELREEILASLLRLRHLR
jgi:hypothetical protein